MPSRRTRGWGWRWGGSMGPGSMSGVVADDENGGSFGPADHGLCLADGVAFYRCQGVDLSPYAGVEGSHTPYKLVLTDSGSKVSSGWIGAADAAETLATTGGPLNDGELVENSGFESYEGTQDDGTTDAFTGWILDNVDASNKVEATATVHGGSNAIKVTRADAAVRVRQSSRATTVGKLYKLTFWHRGDGSAATYYGIYDQGNENFLYDYQTSGVTGTDYVQGTHYFTAPSGCTSVRVYAGTNDVGTVYVDDISLKEVTHVGTTGVHIVSTLDGATRNWAGIESGFDYNAASYTFEVQYS